MLAVLAPPAPGASAQANVTTLRQVRGVLTDENGNRIGWQWITAVSSGVQPEGSEPLIQARIQRLVGNAGEFTLALPDGYYRLSVWTDWGGACAMTGYEPRADRPNAITVAGRAVSGITLALSGARLDEPRWLPCDITEGPAVTELRPGLNLAGWTEAGADVASLFEAIPRLDRAYAWDADNRRYRRAARDGSGDLRTLTPGMGLWLTLGGAEPFTWTRPALASGGLVQLREGRNLVAWAGRDGIPASEAFAGLGDALVAVWHWDETAQRVVRAERPSNTLRTLAKGGAYWVDVSAPREWWQFAPRVEFPNDVTPARQAELRTLVDGVVDFFIERYGIAVPYLTVRFAADRPESCGGSYDSRAKVIRVDCFRPLAHEYTHAIQSYLRGHEESGKPRANTGPEVPVWITEGMANHWSGVYHASTGDRPLPAYFAGTIFPEARRASVPLQSFEIPGNFHSGDRSAHYSLAYLAIEYLIDLTSEDALFTYYRRIFFETDWKSAFQTVFGLDVDQFYRMFEEHRAGTFPPYAARDFAPHANVQGTVLGPSGEPLKDVRVRGDREGPDGRTWQAVTGPDGAFAYPAEPGAYIVSFTDLPPDDCHFGWYDGDGELTSRGEEAVLVTVGDAGVPGIDIRLPAAPDELTATLCARVEGVVQGPDGEPLRGIHTQLYRQDRLNEGNATDAGGAFSIMAPDGAYRFSLSAGSCRLGIYGADGRRWTGEGQQPVVTVTDVIDVTGIIIRLSRPLAELCEP